MTEKEITICGHGSGRPSLKIMSEYLSKRYSQKASNGVRRGLVAVKRLKALTPGGQVQFRDTYKTILGRNIYSQSKRQYVYTKAADGNYYSDCSSSGCATFKKIGYSVPLLNTAGIYQSALFESAPAKIKNGHVTNPDVLQVGDCLLFAGNDPSRPLQIGHVEYIYLIPTSKRYFKPHEPLKRGQAVTFLYRLAGSPPVSGEMPFRDVKSNKYYYNAVLWAVQKYISAGYTRTAFAPGRDCSRAEFITMLYRFAGSPHTSGGRIFTDVNAHDYYFEAVKWAAEKGITTGTTKNTFAPSDICTRAQAVTLLYRYAGGAAESAADLFVDVPPCSYYYNAVAWACDKGVTAGA